MSTIYFKREVLPSLRGHVDLARLSDEELRVFAKVYRKRSRAAWQIARTFIRELARRQGRVAR